MIINNNRQCLTRRRNNCLAMNKLKELTLTNQRVTGNGNSSKEATVSALGTLGLIFYGKQSAD